MYFNIFQQMHHIIPYHTPSFPTSATITKPRRSKKIKGTIQCNGPTLPLQNNGSQESLWNPVSTYGFLSKPLVCNCAVPYCGPKSPKISQGKALVFFGALAKTMITKGIERPNAGTLAFCSALSDPVHSVASPGDMLVGPQLPVRLPRLSSLLWAPGGRCYHIG